MNNIYIISFTKNGANLSLRLLEIYPDAKIYSKHTSENIKLIDKDIKSFIGDIFYKSKAIIFISAIGIAIRTIAPYIKSKDKDPAIIVIDDTGKYIIPILSGHIGGANEIAINIAEYISGEAVITTATDRNNKFAIDVWAHNNNLFIDNISMIKEVSSRLLNNEKVSFSGNYNIKGDLPVELTLDTSLDCGIVISDNSEKPFKYTLNLIPKEYIIGIGARKNAEYVYLKEFLGRVLKENNIDKRKILAIVSIDIKKDEKAINQLAYDLNVPLITYSVQKLLQAKGDFSASCFVKSVTGVDNVCERAVKCYEGADLIVKKASENGFTLAIGYKMWQGSFQVKK